MTKIFSFRAKDQENVKTKKRRVKREDSDTEEESESLSIYTCVHVDITCLSQLLFPQALLQQRDPVYNI